MEREVKKTNIFDETESREAEDERGSGERRERGQRGVFPVHRGGGEDELESVEREEGVGRVVEMGK